MVINIDNKILLNDNEDDVNNRIGLTEENDIIEKEK